MDAFFSKQEHLLIGLADNALIWAVLLYLDLSLEPPVTRSQRLCTACHAAQFGDERQDLFLNALLCNNCASAILALIH